MTAIEMSVLKMFKQPIPDPCAAGCVPTGRMGGRCPRCKKTYIERHNPLLSQYSGALPAYETGLPIYDQRKNLEAFAHEMETI